MKYLKFTAAIVLLTGSFATIVYGQGWWSLLSWLSSLMFSVNYVLDDIRLRRLRRQSSQYWEGTFDDSDRQLSANRFDCKYFCGSPYLRCTVQPLNQTCAGCRDYDSAFENIKGLGWK